MKITVDRSPSSEVSSRVKMPKGSIIFLLVLLQNAEQMVGALGSPHHSMEALALDKKVGYVDVDMVKGYLQALCHQLSEMLRSPSDGGSSRRDTAVPRWPVIATNARLLQQT